MPVRYQDIYPSPPLLNSADLARPSAASLLTLEYFEAPPGEMPTAVFDQHHIVLSYQEKAHRVENFREGVMHDFVIEKTTSSSLRQAFHPAGAGTSSPSASSSRWSRRRFRVSRNRSWACC